MRLITAVTFVSLTALTVPCTTWADKRDGGAIFQEQCVGCHGSDGKATTDMGKQLKAADLTSADVQQQSDSELTKVVKDGQKKMPSFKGKLDDDEIKGVIAYVRQIGKGK
jgi:mono/diheme cytochrome c family protein